MIFIHHVALGVIHAGDKSRVYVHHWYIHHPMTLVHTHLLFVVPKFSLSVSL